MEVILLFITMFEVALGTIRKPVSHVSQWFLLAFLSGSDPIYLT